MTGIRRPSRRELVTGLSVSLAGCSHERIPFVSVEPPPLIGAWFEVTESGAGEFLLLFDGDIQSLLERAPFGRSDVVDVADEKDVDLRFEPVDVSVPENQLPADTTEVTAEKTIQGRIDDFAKTLEWPVHRWYSTKKVVYEKELPEGATAPMYIQFPNGYQYELPAAHQKAKRHTDATEPLFAYGESHVERTFPKIKHYSHPDLVAMRLAAEYRFRVVSESFQLFKWSHYEGQMYEAAREGVAEVMSKLGEAAIEEVVTAPIPGTVTAPLDVKGVHDAVQTDLPKLERALDTIERAAQASVNEAWMQDLTPSTSTTANDDKEGLGQLALYSREAAEFRNPKVTTTNDSDQFVAAVEAYEQLLADQRAITSRLRSPDSTFVTVRSFGGAYWRRLHSYAETLVREFDRMLREEEAMLRELESNVG